MKKTTKTTTDEPAETYPLSREEARIMAWALRQSHEKLRDFEYWMISMGMPKPHIFDDALELAAKLETFARS